MTEDNEERNFSLAVIALMKGVVAHDADANTWNALLGYQGRIHDYIKVLGLELVLDEGAGFAWLKSREWDDPASALPRLVHRRQLSYPVSLLLVLLRQKMVENDTLGEDARLILSQEDMVEMLKTFLPAVSNEARMTDNIKAHIQKVVQLGFLRKMRGSDQNYEVYPILKSFVDHQWLEDYETRIQEYREYLMSGDEDSEDAS